MATTDLQGTRDERDGRGESTSAQVQALRKAIDNDQVGFYHVATAWEGSLNEGDRATLYADVLPELIESFGELELQGLEEVAPRTIRVFGFVRPPIGAVFGASSCSA